MTISIEQASAMVTVPGQLFELDEAVIRGVHLRVWKNAPANGRSLLEASRAHGERAFVVFGDERLSFAEHLGQAATLAHRLVEVYGVRKGDRVAIAVRNLPEWIVAFWAALCAGAIVVPLNSWWTGPELAYSLNDSGAKILIADPKRLASLAEHLAGPAVAAVIVVRGDTTGPGQARWEDVIGTGPWAESLPEVAIQPDDDATILYTSGTTGRPKGAVATHRTICTSVWNGAFTAARNIAQYTGTVPQTVAGAASVPTLVAAPLFHVSALLAQMVPAAVFGGTLVLMPKWNAELALELIEREQIQIMTGVPAMIWQMLESPDLAKRDISSLLVAGYGGAAAPPELFRRVKRLLPSVMGTTGYGITEVPVIAAIVGPDYEARPDSVGVAVATCEVKAVDRDGTEVSRGQLGEFWIKGPNVVRGYWNRPDATAESFTDGWFHTGDIGRIDDQGFLYLIDRAKDMIIRGGENVYSAEVEAALYDHPAITECAVIGIPHRVLGEEVGAVVRFRDGATATQQELQDHVRQRLAEFKVPARIWVHDRHLPTNAAGKVIKDELRDQVLGPSARLPDREQGAKRPFASTSPASAERR